MQQNVFPLEDIDSLRRYVHETLCQLNQLEVDYFPFTERVLLRGGRPCGMFFCLHGPRDVKFTAIWETDRNTVLFYTSTGERQVKTQLTTHRALAPAA